MHLRDAACLIEILRVVVLGRRVDAADQGNCGAIFLEPVHDRPGRDADLMGNGAGMDDTVGGAAGSHQHHDGIADGFFRNDIPGGKAVTDHLDDGFAGL